MRNLITGAEVYSKYAAQHQKEIAQRRKLFLTIMGIGALALLILSMLR